MIASEVAAYLAAQGHGVLNSTLFYGYQDDTPDNTITVYDESAPVIEESNALAVDLCGIQILIRNTSYAAAQALSEAIHRDLAGFGGGPFVTGGKVVAAVFLLTPPTSIGRDDKGRSEWSSHYTAWVHSTGDTYRL